MIAQILIEAFVVGVSTIIMGNIVAYFTRYFIEQESYRYCNTWETFNILQVTLFLTGFLLHIFYEIAGLNKWYCRTLYANTRT